MAENKTKPTEADVDAYLDEIPQPRRGQAQAVRELMTRVTGEPAVMWGPSMIGFGSKHYEGKSTSGDWFVVGLSPRKAALTIYGVYDDYAPAEPLFGELGPHTVGKGCLYLKSLEGIDQYVLERLVRSAWDRANAS
jgi:hypothetical protein